MCGSGLGFTGAKEKKGELHSSPFFIPSIYKSSHLLSDEGWSFATSDDLEFLVRKATIHEELAMDWVVPKPSCLANCL